ncbi:SMI1/KNR4 family protein [Rodentibacter trehalosifermentans]|uniref:SMI1/KNR4 family protein n=1 Tax=Rodentibacter trehalosifermentans TaxID=1908263 RepID=UPI0009872915|nr:SMI1/KNR4 family protein [Rodentibacter trehalosifermentans]OOF46311.1 hypothetical protein BKK53_11970 [Rodentibacter trehalosifermentans]
MLEQQFYLNGPITENIILLELKSHINLPDDYISFLTFHNGGEGFVQEQYLILWKAEELIEFNHDYEVREYVDNLFLIGSNGGGEAIGYDLDTMDIVMIPFIGMDRKYIKVIARSIEELLNGKWTI